jgi:ATP-dependent helicase/nuclease subunit B
LYEFLSTHKTHWPDNALAQLLDSGRKKFAPFMDDVRVMEFWWPEFCRMAEAFCTKETEMRSMGRRPISLECSGAWTVSLSNNVKVTLTAKADRIDQTLDGKLVILDYKSRRKPEWKNMRSLQDPQLPLEALIAQNGHFDEIKSKDVSHMEVWKLSDGNLKIHPFPTAKNKIKTADFLEEITRTLTEILDSFFAKGAPFAASFDYGVPPFSGSQQDSLSRWELEQKAYSLLARRSAWSDGGESESTETEAA